MFDPALLDAIASLPRAGYTKKRGKPRISALTEALGRPVGGVERDAAWEAYQEGQRAAQTAPEAPTAHQQAAGGITWDSLGSSDRAAKAIAAAVQEALHSSPEARRKRNEASVREIDRMLTEIREAEQMTPEQVASVEQAVIEAPVTVAEIEAQMSGPDREFNREALEAMKAAEQQRQEAQGADQLDWDQLVARSRTALEEFEAKHRDSVGFQRLDEQGQFQYFRDMVADDQPFDFDAESLEAEIARVTPVIGVPVPRFVAHLFTHWDAYRREELGRGVLLVLPVDPNFTHGEEWWKRDPEDWRNVVERREPKAFDLSSIPQGEGWSNSHGYWSDSRTVEYHYGADNFECEVNGEIRYMFEEGFDGYPWNILACTVPLAPVIVRMRALGIHTSMSDQYPEDGEWSKEVRIDRAYHWSQVAGVFNTIFPSAAYGRNFSAPLGHVTDIPAPIVLQK